MLDSFSVELPISPQTLVDKLSKKMDDCRSDLIDNFTFNKKKYKGFTTTEKFEIKKCKTLPVSFENYAEAFGKIERDENKLRIQIEIYSIHPFMVIISFGLSALLFTIIALFAVISTLTTGTLGSLYAGLGILAFGVIFLGLPTLSMRWSVKNLKTNLENELKNICV